MLYASGFWFLIYVFLKRELSMINVKKLDIFLVLMNFSILLCYGIFSLGGPEWEEFRSGTRTILMFYAPLSILVLVEKYVQDYDLSKGRFISIVTYSLIGYIFGNVLLGNLAIVIASVAGIYAWTKRLSTHFASGILCTYWIVVYFSVWTSNKNIDFLDSLFADPYSMEFATLAIKKWWILLIGGLFVHWFSPYSEIDKYDVKTKTTETVKEQSSEIKKYDVRTKMTEIVSEKNSEARVSNGATVKKRVKKKQQHLNDQKYEIVHEHEKVSDLRKEILADAMNELNSLVGLDQIKSEIKNLILQLEGQKKAVNLGIINMKRPNLHMVLYGSPGTGKTEVARILGKILYGLGYLETTNFVEADRSIIVGQHIGETEHNMEQLLKKAEGGVLFIDEAYALASGGDNDFGKEAINVLVKAIEDKRQDFVLIMAGYQSDMERLLEMNEGLRSRIPYHFRFVDYNPKELSVIVKNMLTKDGFKLLDLETENEIERIISLNSKNGSVKGNARWARNFVEKIVKYHFIRIAKEDNHENVGVISIDDLKNAAGITVPLNHYVSSNKIDGDVAIRQEALEELNSLIGLESLKGEVRKILNFIQVEQQRIRMGFSSNKVSMHMFFVGPPGTGKTTVARIMGKFLKGAGILSNGHFVEVDRGDLVAEHIGGTAQKVKNIVAKAIGGVLFIDEAYALAGEGNDFGKEAIATLIKEMDDKRDDLIVIFAGYENEMQSLLQMNSGLSSRVSYYLTFPDYTAEEITKIVISLIESQRLLLAEDAKVTLETFIKETATNQNGRIDGNGRWARTLVEKIRLEQNNRIAQTGSQDLNTILKSDVIEAMKQMNI